MTRIRAKCPSCGDVEFGIDAIVVVAGEPGLSDGDFDEATGGRAYRFSRPRCATTVRRAAVADVIELLITAGVRVESAVQAPGHHTPDRPAADRPHAQYPTLTDADVDAFREMLAAPDWFDRLKALDE